MPDVFPLHAAQYAEAIRGGDVSGLIAPPYDVLDAEAKSRLLARNPRNIVAIDLPHMPAKSLGPPEAYSGAAKTYRDWLDRGVLARPDRPAMFVYREKFEQAGRSVQRTGMACEIELVSFGPRPGGGVLPHEETFSGPKEDRLALMRATRAQLSPIFGLHQDARGAATAVLSRITGPRSPEITGTTPDGVRHEVWRVHDDHTLAEYKRALAGEDVFVADGHHRYNTALNYLAELEAKGRVDAGHPARRCMFVLVGMSDPGLTIWPTHRVLGGMDGYSWEAFKRAAASELNFETVAGGPPAIERRLNDAKRGAVSRLGFFDFSTGAAAVGTCKAPDPLAHDFTDRPASWRTLDVALVQHLIVERICQPVLNGGKAVKWAFPHTIAEVEAIGRGSETGAGGGAGFSPQLAVFVRPTPLEAVREISRAGLLMPQKSTFFYPKVATGLFVHPLE